MHGNTGLGTPEEILGPQWGDQKPASPIDIFSYYFAQRADSRPDVVKDCLWQGVKELKGFQILPHGAKPLGRDRPRFWREVGEGIQKALEKLLQQRASRPGIL